VRITTGDVTIDPDAREVLRAGRRLHVPPTALVLLIALAESSPRALSRIEILDRLWPDEVVSEARLRQVVEQLRRALGDDPREPKVVRTVRGFGYALVSAAWREGPTRPAPRHSGCWLLRGTREAPLAVGENLVGRDVDSVVSIASESASRRHAVIVVDERRGASIEDLGSKNGTRVNGERIHGAAALVPGDSIVVGRELFVFCRGSAVTTRTDEG
jgi:DNA-binding winged helix-turn-helix (wHTH) protein